MATPNVVEYPNIALLRQGVDFRFKIRSRALELSMRPLSIQEEDQITQEVIEELEKLPESRRTRIKESILLAVKKLEMAQTDDVGTMNGIRVHAIELEKMTPGELDHLFKQYVAECEKRNPMIDRMDPKEIAVLVEGLKKNTSDSATILTELSFFQLRDILGHLLSQGDSPTDN